jgi:hypothetical protein
MMRINRQPVHHSRPAVCAAYNSRQQHVVQRTVCTHCRRHCNNSLASQHRTGVNLLQNPPSQLPLIVTNSNMQQPSCNIWQMLQGDLYMCQFCVICNQPIRLPLLRCSSAAHRLRCASELLTSSPCLQYQTNRGRNDVRCAALSAEGCWRECCLRRHHLHVQHIAIWQKGSPKPR